MLGDVAGVTFRCLKAISMVLESRSAHSPEESSKSPADVLKDGAKNHAIR